MLLILGLAGSLRIIISQHGNFTVCVCVRVRALHQEGPSRQADAVKPPYRGLGCMLIELRSN